MRMGYSPSRKVVSAVFAVACGVFAASGLSPAPAGPRFPRPSGPKVSRRSGRIELEFRVPVPLLRSEKGLDGRTYTALEVPGCGNGSPVGTPRLPVVEALVATPRLAPLPKVILKEVKWKELELAAPVPPAQEPVPKRPGARERRAFVRRESFYRGEGFRNPWAEKLGRWYEIKPLRKKKADYFRLRFFLFRFDPERLLLRYPETFTVLLTWRKGPIAARPRLKRRPGSVSVLSVKGVGARERALLSRRGFDIAGRRGDRLEVYATAEEVAELRRLGFAFDIVPNEAPRKARALRLKKDRPLGSYHGYEDVTSFVQALASSHPDLCHVESIGRSVEGRKLWAVKISDNVSEDEPEPEVRVLSTMHGDEPPGTELCLYAMDHLLSNYGSDPEVDRLVDSLEIWFIPLFNPDGLNAGTRYNANGVDLNRAFPDRIQDPVDTEEGREPEVAALMRFSRERRFVLACNFHTGALLVNYPFDSNETGENVYTATPDDDLFRYISTAYAGKNPRMRESAEFPGGITNGAEWYVIYGGLQDYSYVWRDTNEVTIEISEVKWPPESALPELWEENREALFAYMGTALTGVAGVVRDSEGAAVAEARVSVAGIDHSVGVDPLTGRYHRMLKPGLYTLDFTAPGYETVSVADVEVVEGELTPLDATLGTEPRDEREKVLVVSSEGLSEGASQVLALYENRGCDAASVTFPGALPAAEIRGLIRTRYQNDPFDYLVLVGDTDSLPSFGRGDYVSDLLYRLLDPDESWEDFQAADVIAGRLPFRTNEEISVYVDKVERFLRSAHDKRFAWVAHGNDSEECGVAEGTHRWVRDNVIPAGAYNAWFPCNSGSADEFCAELEKGLDVVTYSGHGAPDMWVKWSFGESCLRRLDESAAAPLVFSHACQTGKFEVDRCFGELWLLEAGRGALFVGASSDTYWDEDDWLERVEFERLLAPEPGSVGEAVAAGLAEVTRQSPAEAQYYHEIYHVFGDPTLRIAGGIWFTDVSWDDEGNGIPEAGETAQLHFVFRNKMGFDAQGMTISSAAGGCAKEVSPGRIEIGDLAANGEAEASFRVVVDSSCVAGSNVVVSLTIEFEGGSFADEITLALHRVSTVSGRVELDGGEGSAAGARISAAGPGPGETVADEGGEFSLDLIEGRYELTATLEGFNPETLSVAVPPGRDDVVFTLGWSDIELDRTQVESNCSRGAACSSVLALTNPGTRPLDFQTLFSGDPAGAPTPYLVFTPEDPSGPSFEWVPMEGASVIHAGEADDSVWGPFSLPFDFPFFGEACREIYISSNGLVAFLAPGEDDYDNVSLPTAAAPRLVVAALWDDLVFESGGRILSLAGEDRFVVEFRNAEHYDGSAEFSFQVLLFSDGGIKVQYKDVPWDRLTATVGLQNRAGDEGLTVKPEKLSGNVVLLRNRPPWLDVAPLRGEIPPGGRTELELIFTPQGAEELLAATLFFRTTSARTPLASLPVILHVGEGVYFLRGDANQDGKLDISDPILALGYLFGGKSVSCAAALDSNGDDELGIADPIYLLMYLFAEGASPPAPFPVCGLSPRATSLSCEEQACGPE